jgi:hypothetical protein
MILLATWCFLRLRFFTGFAKCVFADDNSSTFAVSSALTSLVNSTLFPGLQPCLRTAVCIFLLQLL